MLSRRTLVVSGLSATAFGTVGYGLWPDLDAYREEVARQRQRLAADPAIADLLRIATLAANGHNTQPWKFRVGDAAVALLPDLARRTEIVDPDDHHLYVSLGCAVENLAIAARAHGRRADVRAEGGVDATIEVALPRGAVQASPLYSAIPRRQSTRSVYDSRPVPPADLDRLKSAAAEEGVSVTIFTAPRDREAVLEFVVAGNSVQMDDPAFVAELRQWLRFSPDRAIATGDGLFSACSGNPVVPEWMGGHVFSAFFTKNSENDKYRDHVRSSAGIAVFSGDRADPRHWIKVGRSFQRFALQATLLGVRTAHLNQPVEVPSVRHEFARWLGAPDARPDLVVRFGYAPALPMSMRRPVGQLIV